MKTRTAAAAACIVVAACATGIAIAQTVWPQLTRADLEACRTVIAQAHQKEFAYIEAEMTGYCSPGANFYSPENCKTQRGWLAETRAQDDVAWYFEGNGRCEGSDYPCFGPAIFNDARTGQEAARWSQIFAEMAAEGSTVAAGMEFYDVVDKADNCAADLWVKKAKTAGFNTVPVTAPATAAVQAAPAPAPAPAPTRISANDPAFQSNLKTFAADQLLALASELLETGEIDLARLARNALLARFPDSPLVPVVAQLITNAAKPGAAPTPSPGAAQVSAASNPAPAARFFINDEAALVSAFSRSGIGAQRVGATNEVRENGNMFSAYLSNCTDGRCRAIQLLSRYSLDPLPAHDRVQWWNVNRLYGRGYLSGKFVCFDMVVPIPSSGIDDKALEEAVVLYKDAANAFYREMTKP